MELLPSREQAKQTLTFLAKTLGQILTLRAFTPEETDYSLTTHKPEFPTDELLLSEDISGAGGRWDSDGCYLERTEVAQQGFNAYGDYTTL